MSKGLGILSAPCVTYPRTSAPGLSLGLQARKRKRHIPGARTTLAQATAEASRAEKETHPDPARPGFSLDPMRLALVRGLALLAEAEARAGQIEAARGTIRRTRAVAGRIREESRSTPLAEIAMAERKMGDRQTADLTLRQAIRIAEGLDNPYGRVEALARVAIVQADSGDPAAARETLNKALRIVGGAASNGPLIDQVLSAALHRVGNWEAARHAALSLRDEILRATHSEGLAYEQAKAGEASDALKWAETLTTPLLRAHALLGVARGITARGAKVSGK